MVDDEPEWATRAELVTLDDKVDAIVTDVRTLSEQMAKSNRRAAGHSADIAEVKSSLSSMSEELGTMGAAVLRIESALKATADKVDAVEDLAEGADEKAERASFTNETDRELAKNAVERDKLQLERQRDSLFARKLARDTRIEVMKSIGKWLGAGLTPLVVIALLGRACGYEVTPP